MSQPGVQSDSGRFNRQVLDQIEERIVAQAKEQFGDDVDLSQGSPIKQLLDVVILEHDHTWKLLEDVYYSAYYGHAYGDQIDKLLKLAQIERIPRRGATGEVQFRVSIANTDDIVIPEGTRVSSRSTDERPSIPFKTTRPARLRAGETFVTVPIRAVEPWESDLDPRWLGAETNVSANTITNFETSVPGVEDVTNPFPTGDSSREHGYAYIQGRDRETDHEFRKRFEDSMGSAGAASMDALRSKALALGGVRSVGIEENVDIEPDPETGLPPKSFRLTLLGDTDVNEVAQTIVETRSAGIQSYGDDNGMGVTTDGVERWEYFSWADEVHVWVSVDLKHDDNYPDDGNLMVENAIIEKLGGTTADGDEYTGIAMGQDVIYDLVWKEVMAIPGVWTADVHIGDDPEAMGTTNIPVGKYEAAMTDFTDVTVFATQEERP